jgi:hypothetical protein
LDNVKASESVALDALKLFERRASYSNTEGKEDVYVENRVTRKISNILELLAEIYDLKKE